jgi:hypothetical protein
MNKLKLSAKALGILFVITSKDLRISAENLAIEFGEGEKAIGTGLKELRDHGLLELRHEVVNGNVIKFSIVTDLGWNLIADFIRFPSPQSPYVFSRSRNPENGDIDTSNEQLSKLILNIYKYKPNTIVDDKSLISSEINTRESHKILCSNCSIIKPPTPLQERLATEAGKQAVYDEKQFQKHKQAIDKRQGRPMNSWSLSDVAMEIAERAANIWSLPPWRFSKSRLMAALTQVRRKWGTDGELEIRCFEFFLRRENLSEYASVDQLWKSFIYQFPEILPKVRLMYPTDEERKENEEVAQKAWNRAQAFLRGED